jgi:hypothetical protein
MTKTLTVEVQHKNAERQLFGARRALEHLVKLYDSGQWRQLYKEDAFAEAVRQARHAVDHWTTVVANADNG